MYFIRIFSVPVNKHDCENWFEDTMEENLNVIKNYPRGNADVYLSNISAGHAQNNQQLMTSFPVIVTAANSGFYKISQGLLKSIHKLLLPTYKSIKIVYYDLGLTASEKSQVTDFLRRFLFN